MSCNTQTFKLGVQNILLGKDTQQIFCVTTKADVSSSLNNKYWVFHIPSTQAKHYIWYNVGGAGTDPAVPNATGHAVAVAVNATANAVATATGTVVAGITGVTGAAVTNNHIEVELSAFGYAYTARDALSPTSQTGFKIVTTQFGSEQVDLGPTNGDSSLSITQEFIDVTAPQTGSYILSQIRKGATVEAGFELKDTSGDAIRRVMNFDGMTVVTDDSDSVTVSGIGSKNLFSSTIDVATQLVFRPSYNADDAIADEDFTIHKAKLTLGEITFSGENELVLPVSVSGYLDESLYSGLNFMSYGDASKIPTA